MEGLKTLDPAIKEKLESAESIEDVIAIVEAEADGFEISREDAEEAWKELETLKAKQQADDGLSLDELEAVSGGDWDRNWLEQGCDSTVEFGSSCWGSDRCDWANIKYQHRPCGVNCPKCGVPAGIWNEPLKVAQCPKCNRQFWWENGAWVHTYRD